MIILKIRSMTALFGLATSRLGVHAIRLEFCDPHGLQFAIINKALLGLCNIICYLEMIVVSRSG